MTGYGGAEEQDQEASLWVEIKGYNNRFLDISVSLPSYLAALEIPLREYLAGRCRRGKIEVSLRYRELHEALDVSLNRNALLSYWDAACEAAKILGLGEQPGLALVLGMEGVLETDRKRNPRQFMDRIMPLLEKAAADFEESRLREGAHTRADILSYLECLERSRAFVLSRSAEMEEIVKNNIRSRFMELLGEGMDENRVYTETAAQLVKYTISEELSRMDAHIREFRAEADRDSCSGKKLDFLCQEINREVNTLGSKALILEVSREVVNMKEALENIREQVRNVE
ncbi:MAG: YicC family protein [Spirochaetaceae bacterium]|nr:YicC family protein [Spirochaetaceae bacterium]